MRLENRVALITGSGGGIGRSTALRLAAEGAHVAVNDLDAVGAEETVALVREAGGEARLAPGDVTSRSEVEAMVDGVLAGWGRLDILVNNAGIIRDAITVRIKDGEPQRMREADWDDVLAVNLKGTFLCCQAAAVPMIRQRYGKIVNTASVSAFGNIGQANYSASKAGIIGLTRTLALELGRHGIHVNAVAPGGVRTRMTEAIPDPVMAGLVAKIPFGRLAEPDEIAAVHAFLASDDASYITGQCLVVDAGARI
ncbi:MAG: 3-oxoacyl-ACP reductase FabG [Ardenticatenales bacterium]|nr:3-oxoacyl-ACP reductase FabG [Ardenticatenales bacterium]